MTIYINSILCNLYIYENNRYNFNEIHLMYFYCKLLYTCKINYARNGLQFLTIFEGNATLYILCAWW